MRQQGWQEVVLRMQAGVQMKCTELPIRAQQPWPAVRPGVVAREEVVGTQSEPCPDAGGEGGLDRYVDVEVHARPLPGQGR